VNGINADCVRDKPQTRRARQQQEHEGEEATTSLLMLKCFVSMNWTPGVPSIA
jgi:hypothetical protein